MVSKESLGSVVTDPCSVKHAGRRAGGSWGRARKGCRVQANRTGRRDAKRFLMTTRMHLETTNVNP